jgi:WD40 repeat protein
MLSCGVLWGGKADGGGVCVWHAPSGKLLWKREDLNCLVGRFAKDGASVFVGHMNGQVWELDAATGKSRRNYAGCKGMILDLAVSPHGHRLLASSRSGNIAMWEMGTGKNIELLSDMGDVRRLAFSPDGGTLLSTNYEGLVRRYRFSPTGLSLESEQAYGSLPFPEYTPDGLFLATLEMGEGNCLRDAKTGKVEQRFLGNIGHGRCSAFDASGRIMAIGDGDGSVSLFDRTRLQTFPRQFSTAGPRACVLLRNPARSEVAIAYEHNPRGKNNRGPAIDLRHPLTHKLIRSLVGHTDWLTSIAYSQDGETLISGSLDKTVRFWNTQDGKLQTTLSGMRHHPVGVALLDRAKSALAIDAHGTAYLWEVGNGRLVSEFPVGMNSVEVVQSNTSGDWLALGNSHGELGLWDAKNRRMAARRTLPSSIRALDFSTDGKRLAVGQENPEIEILDVAQWRRDPNHPPASVLRGHFSEVNSLSFSPDGRRLVSCGRDETVRLYDPDLRREVLMLEGANNVHAIVSFTSDSTICLMADAAMYVWDAEAAPVHKSQLSWHMEQARLASGKNAPQAVEFHLTSALQLEPDNAKLLHQRAMNRVALTRLPEAIQDLRTAIDLKPSTSNRVALGRLWWICGDTQAYRDECEGLWRSLDNSSSPADINSAVWLASLSPDSGIDPQQLVKRVERTLGLAGLIRGRVAAFPSLAKRLKSWPIEKVCAWSPWMKPSELKTTQAAYSNTTALACYRAGRYHEAIHHANVSLTNSIERRIDYLVISMASQKMGNTKSSRRYFDAVVGLVAKAQRDRDAGALVSGPSSNNQELDLRILFSEAEQLQESRQVSGK